MHRIWTADKIQDLRGQETLKAETLKKLEHAPHVLTRELDEEKPDALTQKTPLKTA